MDTILFLILVPMLVGLFIFLNWINLEKRLMTEILARESDFILGNVETITEEDIQALPEPIGRYMRYIRAVGQPKVFNFKAYFHGTFKIDETKPWVNISAKQFNYLPDPTRIFVMKAAMMGITMSARHIHHHGKGLFEVTLLKLKKLFSVSGPAIDEGDLTTFLNDLILIAPTGIFSLQDRITWEVIEDKVHVYLEYEGLKVRAQLIIDGEGRLTNFISDNRYYDEKDDNNNTVWIRSEWSTPILEYGERDSMYLPIRAKAQWKKQNGYLEYADFIIDSVETNIGW
ncbi:MAG: hypothetical protein INQ03_10815 [Candidatus Heimdallarchaeota archaeon]|nr:hypothetical protein [Candidatus Heimdallarchaeota archaeon]